MYSVPGLGKESIAKLCIEGCDSYMAFILKGLRAVFEKRSHKGLVERDNQ